MEPTPIQTLDDLRNAQAAGLKKGDPVVLRDSGRDMETGVYLSEGRVHGQPAIVTIERSEKQGIVRGLYIIAPDGLYYQAHCQTEGRELTEDTRMYNTHFLF